MINEALAAADVLSRLGVSAEVVKLNFINPLDTRPVLESLRRTGRLLVSEDVCAAGSVGSRLLAACAREGVLLRAAETLDLGTGIVEHGSVAELLHLRGVDRDGIVEAAKRMLDLDGNEVKAQ